MLRSSAFTLLLTTQNTTHEVPNATSRYDFRGSPPFFFQVFQNALGSSLRLQEGWGLGVKDGSYVKQLTLRTKNIFASQHLELRARNCGNTGDESEPSPEGDIYIPSPGFPFFSSKCRRFLCRE